MNVREYVNQQIEKRPLEARLLRKLHNELEEGGRSISSLDDGEEMVHFDLSEPSAVRRREMVELAFNLEQFYLHIEGGDWVLIIMGEEPCDMVVDHTMNLDPFIQKTGDWAERNSR